MNHTFITITCLIMALCGFFVIFSKNPIHSILFLILIFIETSFLFIMLNVEFLAMLFLIVYIGAIAVLFLFVVMMLNIKIIELNEKLIRYLPISFFIFLIMLTEILYFLNFSNTIMNHSFLNYYNYYELIITFSNIENISYLLFTNFVSLFVLSGFILLVAMLGAITLTLNKKQFVINQNVTIQIKRVVNEALNVIDYKKKI